MSEPLTKVDSAVQGLETKETKGTKHRRASSSANGVMNINDLGKRYLGFGLSIPTAPTNAKRTAH